MTFVDVRINKKTVAQARHAVNEGEPFITALSRLADMEPDSVLLHLSQYSSVSCLRADELAEYTPDFDRLSYSECLRRQCVVAATNEGEYVFINTDPCDHLQHTWATYLIPDAFHLAFAHPHEMKQFLTSWERHEKALSQLLGVNEKSVVDTGRQDISLVSIAQDESQVVRLVSSTLYDAHKQGASDIHFENGIDGLVVKYRIDGVLSEVRSLDDREMAEQVVSRLKVLAELDIGEKRIPQDGRFSAGINERDIDFRVSVMPGLHGEDVVLRLLDKAALLDEQKKLSMDVLGFERADQESIRRLATQAYGMMLVTGPTGSGKTTTLYAALSELNQKDQKIITIEDPVEYQLPDTLQIPVNEKKGLTFARGLRSILRHDPDKVLVGEIRDSETAEIAIQAALTGHLVYTTVHANNVFDVIGRFKHLDIDMYAFASALNGVVAQRLIRINCPKCIQAISPSKQFLKSIEMVGISSDGVDAWASMGCAHCRGSGFSGRKVICEVLSFDDDFRQLIVQGESVAVLKKYGKEKGMRSMRAAALALVCKGVTTLDEADRVTLAE